MKKIASFLIFAFLVALSTNSMAITHGAHAKMSSRESRDQVNLHFFWSKDCPHCVAAHPFIDELKEHRPWLRVHSYEISGNNKNSKLFEKMAKEHGRATSFVPTFFVCDKMIVGYTSAETTGAKIREAVDSCHHSKSE